MRDEDLEQLANLPDVEGISIDAPVKVHQSASDGCSTWVTGYGTACSDPTSQFLIERGAMGYRSTNWDAWDVGVAVIDSGVSASDDLRVTASYDFRSGVAVQAAPYDGYGHGTHVAGLIAASGSHSKALYQGVAPGAKLDRAAACSTSNGAGYTSNVIKRARVRHREQHRALGIDIINLSLGHPIYEPAATDPLVQAVEARRARRHRGGGLGRQLRRRPDTRTGRLRRHHVAGQRAVGDHRRRLRSRTNTADPTDDTVAPYSSRGPTWYDGFEARYRRAGRTAWSRRRRPVRALISSSYPRGVVRVRRQRRTLRLSGTSMAAGGGRAAPSR